MSGIRYLFLILLVLVSGVGCSSVSKKHNVELSRSVYATNAALKAQRYDLAERYSDQTTRLVSPPKKRIEVKAVVVEGKQQAVLPQSALSLPTLVVGSDRFTAALLSEKGLQGQFQAEEKELQRVSSKVDRILFEKEEIVRKAETQKPSFWQKLLGWFRWLLWPLVIMAGLALLALFPALIPIAVGIGRIVYDLFSWLLRAVAKALRGFRSG